MTTDNTHRPLLRTTLTLAGALAVTAIACSRSEQQTSGGNVDTAVLGLSAGTSAAGPGVYVTAGDSKSVRAAGEYELTDENFAKFIRAADSLQTLQARDTAARGTLAPLVADSPTNDADAGVKRLESNAAVNNAIAGAGLSARDYFVMSIAIANAARASKNPDAAPPTPTLQKNAAFVRGKSAELAHLQALRDGMTPVGAR